jgi:ribosomal protein S9
MSEGTAKENAENQVNTRVSGDKVDEYGLKAARRAPQFSKR